MIKEKHLKLVNYKVSACIVLKYKNLFVFVFVSMYYTLSINPR